MKNITIRTMSKLIDWQFEGANFNTETLEALKNALQAFIQEGNDVFEEYQGYIPDPDLYRVINAITQAESLLATIG